MQKGTFAVTVSQQSQVPGCFVLTCQGAAGGCYFQGLPLPSSAPQQAAAPPLAIAQVLQRRFLTQLLLALPSHKARLQRRSDRKAPWLRVTQVTAGG